MVVAGVGGGVVPLIGLRWGSCGGNLRCCGVGWVGVRVFAGHIGWGLLRDQWGLLWNGFGVEGVGVGWVGAALRWVGLL